MTAIDIGHYCISGASNYAAIVVTLQTSGTNPPTTGFAIANTGWGDDCNPYGGYAVYTYDQNWNAANRPFSMVVMA